MTRAWTPTTDLCDADGRAWVLTPIFRSYGRLQRFCGEISTLRVDGHNPLVREALHTPGRGRVLVVDGGARLDCALLGDQLAQAGVAQGWAGVVVNGAVRDAARLAELCRWGSWHWRPIPGAVANSRRASGMWGCISPGSGCGPATGYVPMRTV